MRKPFTKAMVQVIEDKFKIKMTEDQINAGFIEVEYEKGFGLTPIVVQVGRSYSSSKFVGVNARFKGDTYRWLNGTVENAKLKKMLTKI